MVVSVMVLIIENTGMQRCALDGATIEAFTQKMFAELLASSHSQQLDYYLARVVCCDDQEAGADNNGTGKRSFYCYDAKQLCKFVFEMEISEEGRKVQIKNFKDPIHQKKIQELYFFRLRFDSDTPLRAEYAGSHHDFLENQSFRSRIFANENVMDALSVNFKMAKPQKVPFTFKNQLFSVLLTVLFIVSIMTMIVIILEKKQVFVEKKENHVSRKLKISPKEKG